MLQRIITVFAKKSAKYNMKINQNEGHGDRKKYLEQNIKMLYWWCTIRRSPEISLSRRINNKRRTWWKEVQGRIGKARNAFKNLEKRNKKGCTICLRDMDNDGKVQKIYRSIWNMVLQMDWENKLDSESNQYRNAAKDGTIEDDATGRHWKGEVQISEDEIRKWQNISNSSTGKNNRESTQGKEENNIIQAILIH